MNNSDTRACFLMARAGSTQFRAYAEKLLHESSVNPEDIRQSLIHLDEAEEIMSDALELFQEDPPRGQFYEEWEIHG